MRGGHCSGSSRASRSWRSSSSLLTFEDTPPANPDSPTGLPGHRAAAVGCVAAFFGASELTSHALLDVETMCRSRRPRAPHHPRRLPVPPKRPLLTIRTMVTSSIPVAGIVVALFAAAASVSATALTSACWSRYSPCISASCTCPKSLAPSLGDRTRARRAQARHALPPALRHDRAGGRNRGLSDLGPVERVNDPPWFGSDGDWAGRDGGTGALRRWLLLAFRQPSAGLCHCRALPSDAPRS